MTRDEICSQFLDQVPYDLYPVQEEALLAWFQCQGGVLICAPTGMGKTLIAEAAVFEALHTRRRIYYTTPLIALTEQKYRELQEQAEAWGFSRQDVGFITGNRRENPDALIRVVVAEILLNHLLAREESLADLEHVNAVVMDEFHNFNDAERGVVWELSLALLPPHVRVMLLSATVGNPFDFADWLRKQHGRRVDVVTSSERRVPLEYVWVGDKLLAELLPELAAASDEENRTPALVFCFNRDECWEVAERLKGLPLISQQCRKQIEEFLKERPDELSDGVGPKLRQMLIRGVGVHHAGVLPRHKIVVEDLFVRKLIPYVVCTETLAAGVNLPARSVVLSALLKGKPREKKLIPPASAHQMFGRAGRPQYDTQGYVYAVAHEDDVRIEKWKRKYEQLDPKSKDPGILRARKDLERKRPTRRKNQQYWVEGHFRQLIEAGPAKLLSRSMIPYAVLIFLLTREGSRREADEFLRTRFCSADRVEKFQKQLDHMLANLAGLGYIHLSEDGQHVTLDESIERLLQYRNVDPLYGEFLIEQLNYSNFDEKVMALESVLDSPPKIARAAPLPEREPGPLQQQVLEPLMVQMGIVIARPEPEREDEHRRRPRDPWEEEEERPPTFPEMLGLTFEAKLPAPEPVTVQPKWIAGGAFERECEFFKFVRSRQLIKQEGLVLRHLLRVVLLAGEFFARTEDPEYQRISEMALRTCRGVDPQYTSRYLEQAEETRHLFDRA
jgi:superfamily II DNA/RNA helicase